VVAFADWGEVHDSVLVVLAAEVVAFADWWEAAVVDLLDIGPGVLHILVVVFDLEGVDPAVVRTGSA